MDNELFSGLDQLIFDQPASIDPKEFNKVEEVAAKTDTKVEDKTAELKADDKTKKVEDSKFIDPNDFFNKVKEDQEEDKTVVDKTTDKKEDATPVEEVKPEDLFNSWANEFKTNELLTESDLEGFDGTFEGLISSFKLRENRVGLEMVDDYKSQLPEELKFLADNWEEGVPLNKLIDIRSNKLRYSLITDDKLEESVDTQKSVHAEYLRKTTKYSESKIEKEINRLIDLDELKDESKEGLVELKKFEAEAEDTLRRETKKEQETRKEENAKTIKAYTKVVNETKEVVPGLKLDDKIQKDILNKIINPIGIDGNGNPVSYIADLRGQDPFKFDTAVTYLATITKGFTDWSKIVSVGQTKAVKSLENAIKTPPPSSVRDGIKTTGKQSLMELLEKNKGIFSK